MRILVTGGAGFIGSHLVDKLVNNGHQVYVIDDFSGGKRKNVKTPANHFVRVRAIDCRDQTAMDSTMKEFAPEILFHLAANAQENRSLFSPIDITSRNYDAFIKTITPAIKYGVKRIVFTSSIAVYGALQTPFKETDKPEPEDLYGISKLACEQSLKILSKVHGFEYVIARPHNVMGERQNMSDPYRNVVTIFMNAALRNKKLPLYGFGRMFRQFSYVNDVVDALYKCGFNDVAGKTFNIGTDRAYDVYYLACKIASLTGLRIEEDFEMLPGREQEIKTVTADHELAKKYLNYRDSIDLDGALKRTWNWCKAQGPQEPKYTPLEIPSEKAPKNWNVSSDRWLEIITENAMLKAKK